MIRAYQYNNIHEVKQMHVLHTILEHILLHIATVTTILHYNIHVHVAKIP